MPADHGRSVERAGAAVKRHAVRLIQPLQGDGLWDALARAAAHFERLTGRELTNAEWRTLQPEHSGKWLIAIV